VVGGALGSPHSSLDVTTQRSDTRPRYFAGWRWDLLGEARGRTLEIGSGWGHNFAHYPAGTALVAGDVDLERVREARRRGPWVPLLVADAQRLPWAEATFDTVAGTLVFCSIPQPAAALAEVRRVLRPDGRLLLVEHVRSHRPGLARLQDWLAPAWLRLTGGCNLNRDTEAALRAAGFEIQRRRAAYAGLLRLLVAAPRDGRMV
jgi:ubiquinone/menaquinone biosynthesis C-methylase UbiE